jgi:hypothetical protein
MPATTKRALHYVDSAVQGALLRRIFFHWCGFFSVVAILAVSMQTLLGDPAQAFYARLWYEIKGFGLIGIIMLALLPAFMLDTIRFSNRFVGPVGRLRRSLRELRDGDVKLIQFRGNDFWCEMGDEFNAIARLVESQRKEIVELRCKLETAREASTTS